MSKPKEKVYSVDLSKRRFKHTPTDLIQLGVPGGKRRCSSCLQIKDFSEFHKHKAGKNGLAPLCKSCKTEQSKKRAGVKRERELIKLYGINTEDYKRLLKQQENKCAICGAKNSNKAHKGRLVIDHCHETKKVRGLLCHDCNIRLCKLNNNQESINLLIKTIEYLKKFIATTYSGM